MISLEEALKRKEELLKNNPQLVEYQKKIDDMMLRTRPEDRLQVLMMLIAGKQKDLINELGNLLKLTIKNNN